jgi:pyridine nucleotide-disulfide oxidoreductase family protein
VSKRVVLAGSGHAHLAVLEDWIKEPLADCECYVVTPAPQTAYSGMLPGWMAGQYELDNIFIELGPIVRKARAKLVLASVTGLDVEAKTVRLSNGESLDYDLLSLAMGGVTDTTWIDQTGGNLLPVRPIEQFVDRWQMFVEQAGIGRKSRLAVVGGGAAGIELAMGARAVLGPDLVTLIVPPGALLEGHSNRAQKLARQALQERSIGICEGRAAALSQGVLLDNGQHIPADLVIAATGSRAPDWLAQSGLGCTGEGFVSVGSSLQSLSHPNVFAAGDIVERADRQLERSGVHAVMAGPILAKNLRASLSSEAMKPYDARQRSLYLLSTGDKRAIVSWGRFAAQGRLLWCLKDTIDRRFVSRYARLRD